MKRIVFIVIGVFSLAQGFCASSSYLEEALGNYIGNISERETKMNLYTAQKERHDKETEFLNFKLSIESYLMNDDLSKKSLVFYHKGLSFKDSIDFESKTPSNQALEHLKVIFGGCLYGSSQDKRILDVCGSEEFVDRLDELTELYDYGAWVNMMNDLYELAYIVQDNRDHLQSLIESTSISISNTGKSLIKPDKNSTLAKPSSEEVGPEVIDN